MKDVTVSVDWTRCDGHGLCALMAPETVTLDEWGFPVVARPRDDTDVRRARAAARACPALALRVERSSSV